MGSSKRTDRTVLALSAALFVLVFAVGEWLALTIFEPRYDDLTITTQSAAETVAQAVSEEMAVATGYGIPLARMRGVEPYLEGILRSEALVSRIAVFDAAERLLFIAPATAHDEFETFTAQAVRAGIPGEDGPVGSILVTPSPTILQDARRDLQSTLLASAVLVATLTGVLLRIVLLHNVNLVQARLGASMGAASHGVFADFTPAPSGPLRRIGQFAAHSIAPLRRTHRKLIDLTDEVRALDTSSTFGNRIDGALAPLSGLSFDRPLKQSASTPPSLLWPLFALVTVVATRPLVTSFAADRIGPGDLATIVVALTIAADAVGAALGLLLAAYGPWRGAKLISATGMVVAGVCLAATYVIRAPEAFILAQFGAGLGAFWAIGAAFMVRGTLKHAPWRPAVLVLGAIAIGYPLGGLIAESEGRRMAFLVVGALACLSGFLAIAGPPRRRRRERLHLQRSLHRHLHQQGAPFLTLTALGSITLAVVSFVEITLPTEVSRDDYAGIGLAGALAGGLGLVVTALNTRVRPIALPIGAIVATLALAAGIIGAPGLMVALMLGIASGLALVGMGAKGFGALPAIIIIGAILLAAAAEAASAAVPLEGSFIAFIGVASLALLSATRLIKRPA